MGYVSGEGFEHLFMMQRRLLCASRLRDGQYHVDVVGRNGEVDRVHDWCRANFGEAVSWLPRSSDAQWYNRFNTDLYRFPNWHWSCLWSPWVGGDIENVHVVLWDNAAIDFENQWRQNYFVARP